VDSRSTPGHPAPIVVFAYKRATHLARCLASLAANPEAGSSVLYIYCDGPRSEADRLAVEEVGRVVQGISGFKEVVAVRRAANMGLAASVIAGVRQVLEAHERVIVVEDDLVLSPHFLRYMNDALELYADDDRVASIHGYCYPVDVPLPETFFLRGADCWGWATWRRGWAHFREDGAALLDELRRSGQAKAFDMDGAYPFTRMLADQVAGRNSSWAVRWHASCFLANLLTLYPGRSLVKNIGNDASGTHSKATGQYDVDVEGGPVHLRPVPLEPDEAARQAFVRALRGPLPTRMKRALRSLFDAVRGEGP
jgi:hypothetical protein